MGIINVGHSNCLVRVELMWAKDLGSFPIGEYLSVS